MGGNVGDALAPLVAGALLAVLSWREVVIINVIPGIVMSVVLLVMLGRTLSADGPATKGKAPAPKRTLADTLRDFKPLLANRTLIFLCASSVFRSMTHGGLLTFLPLYLATDMGYSPIWIGACHGGVADRRIHRVPDRRPSVRQDGPPPDRHEQHGDDGGDHRGDDRRRRLERLRVLRRVPRFFFFSIRAVLQAWLLDATPSNMGGSSIGVLFAIQSFGSALGPLICGLIADRYGLITTFYFLVGTIIVANLLIFFTPVGDGRAKRRRASPASRRSRGQIPATVLSRARGWISACDSTGVCERNRSTIPRTNGRADADVTSTGASPWRAASSNSRARS